MAAFVSNNKASLYDLSSLFKKILQKFNFPKTVTLLMHSFSIDQGDYFRV